MLDQIIKFFQFFCKNPFFIIYIPINKNFAIRKYRVTPRISIAVVTNGPVAIAGSISNLSNISGTMDPIVAAIIMDEHILSPTAKPRVGGIFINLITANNPRSIPYNIPSIKPTLISLNKTLIEFSMFTLPVASPRTIKVED